MEMVRELQPGILVNDRLEVGGDFTTPEQYQPAGGMMVDGKPVLWEACQTLNGSWGYHRDNLDWKSVDMLVKMLIDTRVQRRQHAAQRRPQCARRVRTARPGPSARYRRMDAPAWSLHLWLRPE